MQIYNNITLFLIVFQNVNNNINIIILKYKTISNKLKKIIFLHNIGFFEFIRKHAFLALFL